MAKEIPFDPASILKPGDQHDADVRAKQAEFQKTFGDFRARNVTGFWLGPAPQGEWMGMIFDLEDGSQVRAALPIWLFQAFGAEYVLAMNTAAELCEMAYSKPGGSA
jgi:hypothetical protein